MHIRALSMFVAIGLAITPRAWAQCCAEGPGYYGSDVNYAGMHRSCEQTVSAGDRAECHKAVERIQRADHHYDSRHSISDLKGFSDVVTENRKADEGLAQRFPRVWERRHDMIEGKDYNK